MTQGVISVEAFAPNRGELFILDAPPERWRPGKDVAGIVSEEARDGSGPAVGTRVVAHVPAGGWAERVLVPVNGWATIPESIDMTTAAALPLAGLTALRLLRRAGSVTGRRMLITGASGGVGHYLTEMAVGAGADVTAISRTIERGIGLRARGAHTETDLAVLQDRQARFDVSFDSVGGSTLARVRQLTPPPGKLIWFGQASGQPTQLDFFDWIDEDVGAPIEQFHYTHPAQPGDTDGSDLATLVRLIEKGRLNPEIDRTLSWTHTPEIVESLRERHIRGKAVLTRPQPS